MRELSQREREGRKKILDQVKALRERGVDAALSGMVAVDGSYVWQVSLSFPPRPEEEPTPYWNL